MLPCWLWPNSSPAEQHRHALRQQERCEQVARLPQSQRADFRIVGRPLGAAVPAAVVILAVAVVVLVRFVVLLVVAHQVAQREAVVRGDEIDAGIRPAAAVLVQVARAGDAIGELADQPALAFPVVADHVAILAVPLGPADREAPDLVAAFAEVPRLRDQLHLRDDRVLVNDVEERAEAVDLVQLARQRRGEVEAEAVDVHLRDPVAQAVHDHLQHARMQHVQRVAAAGVVHVVARIVVHQAVVRSVVDAAETQRRAEVTAFGGVVVDDVEDHLDAGRVQRLDHRLEFAVGLERRGIVLVRREVADRVVAPVVPQTLLDQVPIVEEPMHWHQLDGGDAEALQVLDDGRRAETGVRAAILRRHLRMQLGEAAHVHLVDDRVVPRRARIAVVAPRERRVDDLALRHAARVVAPILRQVGALTADAIAEVRIAPGERPDDRLRIGIEQQLLRVEAMAVLRLVRAVHAIAVQLPRPRLGQVAVPDLVRLLAQRDALQLAPPAAIEQAQLDAFRMLGEQREVDALAVPRSALRKRFTGPDGGDRVGHSCSRSERAERQGRGTRHERSSPRLPAA